MCKSKLTLVILTVVFMVMVVFILGSITYATVGNKTITVTYRNISIYVNGIKRTPSGEPFIYNGVTYVPLRFVSEALGKEVKWDGTKNRIDIIEKITTPGGGSYGGIEEATILKDFDGDKVLVQRANGEKWILEAKTWCRWSWRYEGKKVLLKFGYVTSILINDDGDTCEFWTEEEVD